jgi:hypothetical protein
MPTYLNHDGILCYRHGIYELYRHSSNPWSTTKYLAICSGRAKVKLRGFVGGHYSIFRTTNYSPKNRRNKQTLTHMHILWPCSTCFRRNMFCRTHTRKQVKIHKIKKESAVQNLYSRIVQRRGEREAQQFYTTGPKHHRRGAPGPPEN